MTTLRIPSSRSIPVRTRLWLNFSPVILRKFARYLEARDGVDVHEFTTHEGLPDLDAARRFADGLCRQLGLFLDEAVSVEQHKNRVMVILRDNWATKI